MKEIINFTSSFKSLEQVNPLITKGKINICVPDEPANKYIFSKEIIESMANTIRGAGVYAYYFDKEQQLGGHEDNIVKTPYGYRKTGKPIAYGFADPYKEPYWEEKDGKQWYTADVFLWTGVNPELEEIIANQEVFQSMEVSVDDVPDINGNKKVTEAVFLKFCLLQGINPAFSNSKLEVFTSPEAISELEVLKQEFANFVSKYNSLDFTIPQKVKESANQGLDLYKKYNANASSVALANARYLVKNEFIKPEKVKNIAKYFNKLKDTDFSNADESDSKYISFCMYGGTTGYSWSAKLAESMQKIDSEKHTYFNGLESDKMVEFVSKEEKSNETDVLSNLESNCEHLGLGKEEGDKVEDENKQELADEAMSSNMNVDAAAAEVATEKEAETNEAVAEENMPIEPMEEKPEEEDKDQIIAGMKTAMAEMEAKMKQMEEQMSVYMSENEKLQNFKSDIEMKNKEFEVTTTLNDVGEDLPKEEIEACRLSAEKFTLDNIDVWKNEVKAKAFNFTKGIKKTENFTRMALPNNSKPIKGTGLWD